MPIWSITWVYTTRREAAGALHIALTADLSRTVYIAAKATMLLVEETCIWATQFDHSGLCRLAHRRSRAPARRAAAGRHLSGLRKGDRVRDLLDDTIGEAKERHTRVKLMLRNLCRCV
jgi:hypothetical protein